MSPKHEAERMYCLENNLPFPIKLGSYRCRDGTIASIRGRDICMTGEECVLVGMVEEKTGFKRRVTWLRGWTGQETLTLPSPKDLIEYIPRRTIEDSQPTSF